jgi:hypothetical protein
MALIELTSLRIRFHIFRRFGENQRRALEHPAEIFFARLLMFAAGKILARGGLVTDFQPFQLHDADVLRAALPNLTLL